MLTSQCSDDPAVSRVWKVHNPNGFAVPFTWDVFGVPISGDPHDWTSYIRQTGTATAVASADTIFASPTVAGPNPAAIIWQSPSPPGYGFWISLSSTVTCATPVRINPQPGQNVNMVSGTGWPGGDPFLQRQNEPSVAFSTRSFDHLVAGANDYRTVDLPNPAVADDEEYSGDAWLGLFKSFDGGHTWQSTLVPGYPQDQSPEGVAFRASVGAFGAAADPVVRAGTSGLFYYAGIAFNRPASGSPTDGALFVARFLDLNNKENGDATLSKDPIRYLGAAAVDFTSATAFVDKPAMAVDIPRGGTTCTFSVPQGTGSVAQTVPAGSVYLAYSAISGTGPALQGTVYFAKSSDCGTSWSPPIPLSTSSQKVSQGAAIAVDPASGSVYVAWRQFASGPQQNAINVVKVTNGDPLLAPFPIATVVSHPSFDSLNPTADTLFDQGTTPTSIRTNAYPTLAVDGSGRVYLAWSQRNASTSGDARVMLSSSTDGSSWSAPSFLDNGPVVDDTGHSFSRGHQFMPQMTFNGGRLTALYYDLRLDHTLGLFNPVAGFPTPDAQGRFELETRGLCSAAPTAPCAGEAASQVFTPFIDDFGLTFRRHTLDLRLGQAGAGAAPSFTTRRLSQYKFGTRGDETSPITYLQQLQVNPPNLPMFQQGAVPFLGDYIDVAGVPFVQSSPGGPWAFNTAPSKAGTQFAVWTSNQDVVPPYDPTSGTVDWALYTPPRSLVNAGDGANPSLIDPLQTVPACESLFTGSRNQNIYGALVTQDFLFSSPQNSKPLSTTLQRAFVVVAQNLTGLDETFRLVIENQPPGGWASFTPGTNQPLAAPAPLVTTLDLAVAAHSSASRSVFATSSSATAPITVNIAETSGVGGPIVVNGLTGFVTLNSDASVPGLVPPDDVADGGTIATVEVYAPNVTNPNVTNPNVTNPNVTNSNLINPNVTNPNVTNPNVTNPNVTNPNVTNADIANPNVTNPNVTNPNVTNPNVTNPNVTNPNVTNPNVTNPNVTNVNPSDASYTVTNTGNTTTSYRVTLVGSIPAGVNTQLIITKSYKTTAAQNCELFEQDQELLVASILNPTFTPPGSNLNDPALLEPGIGNPTVALKPNESATVTIRAYTTPQALGTIVTGSVTPVVVAQAPNTNDPTNTPKAGAPGGTIITPGALQILTAALPDGVVGAPYAATLTAAGGTAPYAWDSFGGTPPAGITLFGSGSITGTPTGPPGTASFTAKVLDSAAATSTRPLSIRVASPLASVPAVLPTGTVGVAYATSVSATGGIVPISFSLLSGSLPAGLSLSAGGAITGAPLVAGTTGFVLRMTDSSNPSQSAIQSYSITVDPAAPPVLFFTIGGQPSNVAGAQPFNVTAHFQDSVGGPIPGALVSLALGATPCAAATLAGPTSVVTNGSGDALFIGNTVVRGGYGYTLVASAAGASPATSNAFDVEGFCDTGGLSSPRKWHTATRLADGRVLVAGGFDGSAALASAELYDPVAGTFTPTGSMGTARALHSATLLPNGNVLIVGGGSGLETGTVNTAELYDPVTGGFTPTASLVGHTRQMHGAALLNDGRVLVAGGFTNDGGIGGLATAELYDPVAGTFAATSSGMTHDRIGDFTTTLLPDGRVLLAGGFQNFVGGPSTDGELFEPSTGTFSPASNLMSTFRGKHTATLRPDAKVVLAGGENDTEFLASADLFDPASSSFGAAPSGMAITRESHTASRLANGKTLMAAGQTLIGSATVVSSAERYDTASGSSPTGPLSVARLLHTATPLSDGRFLIVGGEGTSGSSLSQSELFFPSSRLNITTTSIPTGFQSQPYSATLLTASGTPPFVWTAMAPLPSGLVLDPAGVLAGTPSVAGATSVWLKVTDAASNTAFATYPLFVASSTATNGPVTISAVAINGGGNEAVVLAGSTVNVGLSYTIVDAACPACIDQIPIGFADSVPTTCAYDGIPGPSGASGSTVVTLTAPSTPGRHYIGFDRSQALSCSGALGFWWNGRPGPDRYIGALDVVDPNATDGPVTIHNGSINGGGIVGTVSAGAGYSISLDYFIFDVPCPGCIDQIQMGLTTGQPEACAYNGIPGPAGVSGSATVPLTAPSVSGRYSIGFDRSQQFFCPTGAWWNPPPPGASRTVGVIVVP